MNNQNNLQIKIGDDAVFYFTYMVYSNNGLAVREVIFGYYKREHLKQTTALQRENLVFNPKLNVSWRPKINITADLNSVAEVKLTNAAEKDLFNITFYCSLKYDSAKGSGVKTTKIKLDVVCKYTKIRLF